MSSGAQARSRSGEPPGLPERYQLRSHIASGGMASVWCAEDRLLARPVAIKILAERFAHDQLAVRRFKREARAAARVCEHNHVVTVFDVGDTEPAPGHDGSQPAQRRAFIVMEYLAGGTVADAVRVGAVRRHEALRWLGEAASALDYAHDCGIVHRDIKPANFLLDRNRVLHVADFGIARLASEDTITSTEQLFGTAAYLAPEQALGRPATGASDRYAFAVAAFELLAGERPFAATHFAAQARQHVEDERPRASERNHSLPPAVDPILQRGMAKQADARFESAGELVASLQRALTEGTMNAPRRTATRRTAPGRPRTPDPTAKRHRGRAIALLALALVVIGVAAAAFAARGGPDHHATTTQARVPRTVAGSSPRHRSAPPRPRPRPSSARTTTAASTSSTTTTTTATSATAPSASQLQLTGHQEMLDGDYPTAIDTLREAVSSSDPGSLTYAYALYDLGRSLVLSGDPSGAIPVLQKRLAIPNQTPVVRQMLNQALRAAGHASPPPARQTPAPANGDHGSGQSKGKAAPTGGAGLT